MKFDNDNESNRYEDKDNTEHTLHVSMKLLIKQTFIKIKLTLARSAIVH